MLPLVCNDALVVLFLFDLTNRSTLTSVREWYRQVRGLNKARARPAGSIPCDSFVWQMLLFTFFLNLSKCVL
jgi:GTPase SAR1 family protein